MTDDDTNKDVERREKRGVLATGRAEKLAQDEDAAADSADESTDADEG